MGKTSRPCGAPSRRGSEHLKCARPWMIQTGAFDKLLKDETPFDIIFTTFALSSESWRDGVACSSNIGVVVHQV